MENKFIDAMKFRFANKEFECEKKISDEDFKTILDMGRLSPSSFGFEPWKFVVVQNPTLRSKLQAFTWGAQGQLPTASHFVLILARKASQMRHDSEYITHILKDIKGLPEDVQELYKDFFANFQKNDFKLLGNDRALFDWSCKQTYIALSNMLTGAAFMGIDSCAIEGFDIDKTNEFLKNDLNIDTQEFGISVMAAFGYRKNEPSREKSRQDLDDIMVWYE